MVVRMKKLNLLLHRSDRDAFLDSLQSLGVIHVVLSASENSSALEPLIEKKRILTRIAAELKRKKVESDAFDCAPMQIDNVIEIYTAIEAKETALSQKEGKLKKERDALLPWGEFDPSLIEKLARVGVSVRLFDAPLKTFNSLDFKDALVVEIGKDGQRVLFAVTEKESTLNLPLEPVVLPTKLLSVVEGELAKLAQERANVEREKNALVCSLPVITDSLLSLDELIDMESVKGGMVSVVDGKVLALKGFFPADKETGVLSFLKESAVYFNIEEPVEGDPVPVALKNNSFVKLFEPITKIFSLPDYFEFDPTPFFAPFFTLFVGLCLGDIGYGAVLLVLSLFLVKKGGAAMKPMGMLIMVLAASTVFGGLLLNSFFGNQFFLVEGKGFFDVGNSILYFAPLSQRGTDFPAMRFAMAVGFVQVIFAMLIKAVLLIKTRGFVFGLQPFSFVLVILGGLLWGAHANPMNLGIGEFTVGPLLIGALLSYPPVYVGKAIFFIGLTILVVFNNPDKPLLVRVLGFSIITVYNFVTGLLGDILSYLRIFALGLAGGLLGNAFNGIAFSLVRSGDEVNYASPLIVLTVLILIFGHGLNLALSMIGSFVHPLRLTFVEFYKNLEFRGGGKAYRPFATNRINEE